MLANLMDLSEDTSVWRVFDSDYFINDVENRTLTLLRVCEWDDPFENFLAKCTFIYNGHRVDTSAVLGWFFGQCWTVCEEETDATWRIYSHNKRGVRVRSNIGALFRTLCNPNDKAAQLKFFAGRVKYLGEAELLKAMSHGRTATAMLAGYGGADQVRTLFMKRAEFSHENEARLIFRDIENQYVGKKIFQKACDPNDIYLDATFDPRMPLSDFSAAEKRLKADGFAGSVSQSKLYQLPITTIELA